MKVGVIGVGSMGKNHARVYSEMADLVGIADINEKNGKRIAKRYNAEYFKDYHDLLNIVDALTIATPTNQHFDIAMDAIANGKHLLIEKPIADSVKKGERLMDAAREQGVVLAIGHIERHNPVIRYVKEALKDGRFGKMFSLSGKRLGLYPPRIRDVGVTLDLGIHEIDIMGYLAGSRVVSVYSSCQKNIGKFEDNAIITLNYENGIIGFIEVNWLTPMKIRKLFLTCEQNLVELDYIDQSVNVSSSYISGKLDKDDLYSIPFESDIRHISVKRSEPLKNELLDFLDAVEKKAKPLVSGKDGVYALEIVDAALKSQEKGKPIFLDV